MPRLLGRSGKVPADLEKLHRAERNYANLDTGTYMPLSDGLPVELRFEQPASSHASKQKELPLSSASTPGTARIHVPAEKNPLAPDPVLKKINELLGRWAGVTVQELLEFEEQLVTCADNTAGRCNFAAILDRSIWAIKDHESRGEVHAVREVRGELAGMLTEVGERLLQLTFVERHGANDRVARIEAPQNRVRFHHHPPATDWTSDKMLELAAGLNPMVEVISIDGDALRSARKIPWPAPAQGVIRHRVEFSLNVVLEQPHNACVHVFNSRETVMDQPD